ncbi:MAG TPA: SMP-30/gluconolactonase/LRE family protein [Caulifigura sp.]|nr:SMP-30/gluconolactonase/LRE family protein [Caulifigura sp.]
MLRLASCLLALLVLSPLSWSQEEDYPENPDAVKKPGVPEGKIEGPFKYVCSRAQTFPGTTRDYWVYVPAAYDKSKPACVLVCQDGVNLAKGWKLPSVMDNLIHEKAMPVTIGIFINPGIVPAPNDKAQPRFNRSFEYDGMGDRYARFLIDEILPEVGKTYNLSSDPNDRAIAGSSSGGIAAFTVAWERPDAFRRVLSGVGTFVGLRGGDAYAVLVRKTEPKPIRVFLQDGENDNDIYPGSWWQANQELLRSLEWSGYDVGHAWGKGGHNSKHMAAISGQALRWLWRDYPKPIEAGIAKKHRIDILIPGEGWKVVSEGHKFTEGGAVNAKGEVFFTDIPNNRIHKIGVDGQVSVFAENTGSANGLEFGPDGKLYACQNGLKQIGRFDESGKAEAVVTDVTSNDLVVLNNGTGYFTDPTSKMVWWFNAKGEKKSVDKNIERPNGIALSPDQTLLNVADSVGRFIYSFQIQPDGSLAHKQQYGWLHTPDESTQSGADGMIADTEGRLYVTTRLGLQILDQPGRVHVILPSPNLGKKPANVVIGGPQRDTIYLMCGDKVYSRKSRAKGLMTWEAPITPPKPQL